MGTLMYAESDNVDVYVDGRFRNHGEVVSVSESTVTVHFPDQDGETKACESPIRNTLATNTVNGNWEIDVPASIVVGVD
jgi:hypothetical protein